MDHAARGASPAIDWACPEGTPVLACADGDVVWPSGENVGEWGKYQRIDHGDGLESGYAHLSQRIAQTGQRVKKGDIIGLSGWTGKVDPQGPAGAHLHWEVFLGAVRVDPLPYLQQA